MTIPKICEIDGCDKTASRKALCNTHYLRLRRHGDVNKTLRPANGSAQEFFKAHVGHKGSDCLIWPFVRDKDGRGRMMHGDRTVFVHRQMCIEVHGEPPSPIHEAAHGCGKGHEGCFNGNHLRWATPIENASDRKIHGTEPLGEDKWSAKLTKVDVLKIREMKGSMTQRAIGDMFGVDAETIGDIFRRRTWAWLKER